MFDYNAMIKRAIEYFPLWSDIRKRHTTSVGGRFLSSMIEEAVKTEDAIQEYIDSYFLYNYIGHEDEVMAYVYKTQISLIDSFVDVYIYYNDKNFIIAKDLKEFQKYDDRVFYEDGYIYLKIEDYINDVNTIEIQIEEYISSYKLELVHVWNIFDEFATFVNTRRYINESNKELLDRILYITKNLPNGTDDGIKHAIISELMTDCPELTMNDIKIEAPTPENLIKPYEDYETLLDMLAEVNRDVYRTKRWDLDYWEYDFESISYIPHIWDKAITTFQNGVGSYNDLEVILADKVESTDVTIYLYKKTLDAFQKYIYDKYIDNDIHFTLTKYNDILNKTNIKYKISASELKDITEEDIKLKIYENNNVYEDVPIENIAVDWGKDVQKINNNIIDDIKDYRLDFKSKNGYDLVISKANVVYTNKDTGETEEVLELLENKPGFVYTSEYEIVSDSNKLTINNIENFNESNGLKNDSGGITLNDGYSIGTASISLTNKANLYVNYRYDCDTVLIPDSLISCRGGYWATRDKHKEFVIRGDYSTEDKTFMFTIEANYVSFRLADTNINSTITLEVDDELYGTNTYDISHELLFETKQSNKPRHITFKFSILSLEDVILYDFKYNNYIIELSTKYGTLKETDKGYQLSNFYNNVLTFNIMAGSGHSPYIYGIYIGEDYNNIVYTTKNIPYRSNCIRSFEIRTNGTIDLISADKTIENYKPITSYKGVSDNAYMRIDLSEYETIDKIETEASIEKILESGKIYYNLRLKNGQEINTITIKGTRTKESRVITIEDMVLFYLPDFNPTYDTIYCSKTSKGLIIGRQNPGGTPYNELITIKSDAFLGINAIKYVMDLPSYLGTIYGVNSGGETRNNIIYSSFDYISIYPANSQIYTAINEYDTYIQINKNISIANNFTPKLDTSKLLFYTVELYDDTMKDNVFIRFHSELTQNHSIYDMPSWSIGTSNSYIAIQNNIDLLNNISYDMSKYNINIVDYLSSSVDIQDTYELTDHTILNTTHYIINTDNDQISIKYDRYDGSIKKSHLLKTEEIIVGSNGFNKLIYSNIDTIFHISKSPVENDYIEEIESFTLLKDEGIIIWNDEDLIKSNVKVYLVYSIRKPVAFVFDLEYLYKAIDYDVEAYSHISTHIETNLNNQDIIYLNEYEEFQDTDLVYVSCSEPTFEAQLEDNIITINKYTNNNTILVKTGYYYINGREYYLFSEDDPEKIKNNKLYDSHNIDISGGEITTYKETNNYLSNSEMRLKGMSNLYHFDCTRDLTYGISSFNSLTSCESFNEWQNFGMKLSLVDGLNGLGLKFEPLIDNAYSFIDITNSLSSEINYLSFYATQSINAYLGIEEKYLYFNLERPLNISIEDSIPYDNSDIRSIVISKKENYRYYLIIKNEGVVDDIIISNDINSIYEGHTKNISLLGIDLYERKTEGSQYKMALKTHKDYTPYYAGLMSDGSIKTTSNIDWYITEVKRFEIDTDFKQCILKNIGIEPDYCYTTNLDGELETPPIFIHELNNIKRLIFKINNINFDNMKDFVVSVYTSEKANGKYINTGVVTNNIFHLNNSYLNKYIKLKIHIPAYKFIDNITILAEYTSSNEDPLSIITKQSGYIISKVYDLQDLYNCIVKSIDLIDISNINDVEIYIRSSRDVDKVDIWSDWKRLNINDKYKIINMINFNNTRFLQFKIVLKHRNAYIKLQGINIEIK